tara:strand:+ start:8712 stop:9023 length:312 start_codon:yes stop_codon:yes gene_type:complete
MYVRKCLRRVSKEHRSKPGKDAIDTLVRQCKTRSILLQQCYLRQVSRPCSRNSQNTRGYIHANDAAGRTYSISQLQDRLSCTATDVQNRLPGGWGQGVHSDQA